MGQSSFILTSTQTRPRGEACQADEIRCIRTSWQSLLDHGTSSLRAVTQKRKDFLVRAVFSDPFQDIVPGFIADDLFRCYSYVQSNRGRASHTVSRPLWERLVRCSMPLRCYIYPRVHGSERNTRLRQGKIGNWYSGYFHAARSLFFMFELTIRTSKMPFHNSAQPEQILTDPLAIVLDTDSVKYYRLQFMTVNNRKLRS